MLNENIRAIRKSKGLSQDELAIKLNVVRQTVSKWENGLSVPDSDMLISISEVLETPVSVLLGEAVPEAKADDLKAICEKLEVINLQLAQRKKTRQKIFFLDAYHVMCSYSSGFGSHHSIEQPVPGLGLQRPRNRGFRNSLSRL